MRAQSGCVHAQEMLGKSSGRMHKVGRVIVLDRLSARGRPQVGVGDRAMRDPDEELVGRVGAGDKRAAAELVRRHLPRMVGLARRMLGNAAEADDVAQEVFLRVWKHAAAWKPGQAKFETWMHRVAMNLCLDRLRRAGRNGGEVSPDTIDGQASATRALDDRQRRERVRDALGELPERQRAALVLCYYQDRTNIEAAEILGVSVEALESLLSRARRTLKSALAAERADLLSGLETG
jgi:RNA polymerase sigma-70 factor (ECF subfamily)